MGDAESPYVSRFDWCTHSPPVRSFRIQNAPASTFESETEGVRLNLFRPSDGSVNEGVQSTSV